MFGPHVNRSHAKKKKTRPSIADHILAAKQEAAEVDFSARAFQVFIAGPRNMTVSLKDEEITELRALLDRRADLVVVAHGTYMDYPWHGSAVAAKFIRRELEICERAGITGLVVHLGKPGIDEVMEHLPQLVVPACEALIYLEVPHVLPANSHYETPEKLAALFSAVRQVDPALCHFGLCIDTAHLWSCGVDLGSFEAAEEWLRRLERVADVIPPDRIIIHLNDSHDARGSGVDHHAPLLAGKMWGEYATRPRQSGLAAFVDYIVRNGIITILERSPQPALLDDYTALERLTAVVRADD